MSVRLTDRHTKGQVRQHSSDGSVLLQQGGNKQQLHIHLRGGGQRDDLLGLSPSPRNGGEYEQQQVTARLLLKREDTAKLGGRA